MVMAWVLLPLWVTVALLISPTHSATCKTQKFTSNRIYSTCLDLPHLSSHLHWTFNASNSSISLAVVAPPAKPDGWIAWAINPTKIGMVGAQSLLAMKRSDGVAVVKTYNISSYSSVVEQSLSLEVWDQSAEFSDGVFTIFANMKVPEKAETINQIWQAGPSVTDGNPNVHDFQVENLMAKGTLSLTGSQTANPSGGSGSSGVDSRTKRKNIHGVLNAVSWGILFPAGVVIARYLRTFESADPVWFYLHVSCQISAYAVGVAGWATGLKLGSESKGIQWTDHRNLGIALFSLATVQIFALFLRPKKDHKYRFYWNIYHHSLGYTIVILGVLNVFKGLDILKPAQKWKSGYIIAIVVLGGIALILEAVTWVVVLRRKSNKSTKPYDGFNNGQTTQQPLSI